MDTPVHGCKYCLHGNVNGPDRDWTMFPRTRLGQGRSADQGRSDLFVVNPQPHQCSGSFGRSGDEHQPTRMNAEDLGRMFRNILRNGELTILEKNRTKDGMKLAFVASCLRVPFFL